MKKVWLLILLTCNAASAQQDKLTLDSFNHITGIVLGDGSSFHEVTLPYTVYAESLRFNLDDLRVFNGQQEIVPYALYKKRQTTFTQTQETSVPIFPIITRTDQQSNFALEVQRNNDGTIISLRQPGIREHKKTIIRGVVFDASNIKGHSRSLTLKTEESTVPFHPFTLESSNDLQNWNLVKANNQLVQLRHNGRLIEKNTIDWYSRHGKYLRLIWSTPELAPKILSATVSAAKTSTSLTKNIWSPLIKPTLVAKNIYEYSLPGFVPAKHLRFDLAQINTLTPIQIQYFIAGTSKHNPDRWQTISSAVLYRLNTPQGDIHSDDIKIHQQLGDRIRLVIDERSGGIGNIPPTLQIGFIPHNIVFLPRGEGPYTLAWGSSTVKNASLPMSTLIPDFNIEKKFPISTARLDKIDDSLSTTTSVIAKPGQAKPSNLLWIVLMAGVLVLAGMAFMLVKQIKQSDKM